MNWSLFAVTSLGAALCWGVAALRARKRARRPEDTPLCVVASLTEGRFRVVGRIAPIRTIPSAVDGTPCVYRDVAEYRAMPGARGALRSEIAHEVSAHPFFVDDGTGHLLVDPRYAEIEAVSVSEDDGLTTERRLRAGEEIEVVGTMCRLEVEREGGPYRGATACWGVDASDAPPKISYRTAPEMLEPSDDVNAFFRGAGFLLVFAGALIGALAG